MKNEWNKRLKLTGQAILRLIYPSHCPLCEQLRPFRLTEQPMDICCDPCRERLPWIKGAKCLKCGKQLTDERREYCIDCATQQHSFEQGAAAFTYTGRIRQSVYRMKFQNRRDYIPFYAASMAQALQSCLNYWQPEAILPVPMHPSKKRRRGYNQSELLARELSRITHIPLNSDLLHCIRKNEDQKTLNRQERMRNLRGSFTVTTPHPPLRRVLLVDDVYTTGSTMDEISRVLKEHGVRYVYFIVLCTGRDRNNPVTYSKPSNH
jgi:ComF family protein